jgi:hypothetical protein
VSGRALIEHEWLQLQAINERKWKRASRGQQGSVIGYACDWHSRGVLLAPHSAAPLVFALGAPTKNLFGHGEIKTPDVVKKIKRTIVN